MSKRRRRRDKHEDRNPERKRGGQPGSVQTHSFTYPHVRLSFRISRTRISWELKGDVRRVDPVDRERIANQIAGFLAVSHESVYREIWEGMPYAGNATERP